MEVFIALALAMIVSSVAIYLCSSLWFTFRWNVFGWRPKILDEKVVNETIEECVESAVENDAHDAEELHGYIMTDEEKRQHRDRIQEAFRMVIERYIRNFATKS